MATIISSPLEILALFSTDLEYFMRDCIDYEVLYITAYTHIVFSIGYLSNMAKLLNVRVFMLAQCGGFVLDVIVLGRHGPVAP